MNWTYKREEAPKLGEGTYRVVITNAEETTSKAGNQMLVITLRPSGSNLTIKHYIVQNDYFNRNMTDFYDAFDIPEGNFNLVEWIGAMGAAKLKEDDMGYLKVSFFVNKARAEKLPEFVGEKPERQKVDNSFAKEMEDVIIDDEELLF